MALTRKKAQIDKDEHGNNFLTPKYLQDLCYELELYSTPRLNDKLYLHFKGINKIQCLEEYYNLKALFLENNMISKIENISHLKQLKSLYLQNNVIETLEELDELTELYMLNLQRNKIKKIENLSQLKSLNNLDISYNQIQRMEDIYGLIECPSLATIELSYNQIESSDGLIELFQKMPNLKCLYLRGNPVVRNISNYRKVLIANILTLTYLDDRPVTTNERRTAEAWLKGGKDAETEERQKIHDEVTKRDKEYVNWVRQNEEKARQRRVQELEKLQRVQLYDNREKNEKDEIDEDTKFKPYHYQIKRGENGELTIHGELSDEQKQKIKKEYLAQEVEQQSVEYIENSQQNQIFSDNDKQLPVKIEHQQKKVFLNEQNEHGTQFDSENHEEHDFLKWNDDIDMLLETILVLFSFDFEKAHDEFMKALKKNNINEKSFSINDLRKRWTFLEIKKQKKDSNNKIEVKNNITKVDLDDLE